MPFYEDTPAEAPPLLPSGTGLNAPPRERLAEAPPLAGALWRTVSPLGMIATSISEAAEYPPTPGFDVRKFLRETAPRYEQQYLDDFHGVRSEAEARATMRRIDRVEADQGVVADAGWPGTVAAVGAGILDPTIFLPGGALYRAARGGYSAARSALSVGAAAGAQGALVEGIAQITEPGRTAADAIGPIAASTILGGIIGAGAAKFLSRAERQALEQAFARDVQRAAPAPGAAVEPTPIPEAGAAVADQRGLNVLPNILERIPGVQPLLDKLPGVSRFLSNRGPMQRSLASDVVERRRIMADLGEVVTMVDDNVRGVPTSPGVSVEAQARYRAQRDFQAVVETVNDAWKAYDGGSGIMSEDRAALARLTGQRPPDRLTAEEFRNEVGKAMFRDDKHEIPEVQQAAEKLRPLQKALEAELQRVGILPESLGEGVDPSWFHRMWNKAAMNADPIGTRKIFADWLEEEQVRSRAHQERLRELDNLLTINDGKAAKIDAVLARLDQRMTGLRSALTERAGEVKRAGKREGVVADRAALIGQEVEELQATLDELRTVASDPASRERLADMEKELAALRQAERRSRVSPTDLDKVAADVLRSERAQADRVLADETTRIAAEMLSGNRSSEPKVPTARTFFTKFGIKPDSVGADDLRSALGPERARRYFKADGDTLDDIGLTLSETLGPGDVKFDADGNRVRFTVDEVVQMIAQADRERVPSWWHGALSEKDRMLLEAADRAVLLDRAMADAGLNDTSMAAIKRFLGQGQDEPVPAKIEDVDRALAEMEAARAPQPKPEPPPAPSNVPAAPAVAPDVPEDVLRQIGALRLNRDSWDRFLRLDTTDTPESLVVRSDGSTWDVGHNENTVEMGFDRLDNAMGASDNPDFESAGLRISVFANEDGTLGMTAQAPFVGGRPQLTPAQDAVLSGIAERLGIDPASLRVDAPRGIASTERFAQQTTPPPALDLDALERELAGLGGEPKASAPAAVPPSVALEAGEARVAAEREGIKALRDQISATLEKRRRAEARGGKADARVDEAQIALLASRNRLEILGDQLAQAQRKRELALEMRRMLDDGQANIRGKVEEVLTAWKGDSADEAKSAIKAREKYRAERTAAGTPPQDRLTMADGAVDTVVKRILASDRELSRQELDARAGEIFNRIIGTPDGRLPYDSASSTGPQFMPDRAVDDRGWAMRRAFAIPSERVMGLLDTDAPAMFRRLLNAGHADIALIDKFGDVAMEPQIKTVLEAYDRKIGEAKTAKERAVLTKEKDAAVRDIAAVRDRIRGTFGWSGDPDMQWWGRVATGVRRYNNITSLGNAGMSSIPDLAGAVARWGFDSVLEGGYKPLIQAFTGGDPKAWQAAKRQAKALALAVEMFQSTRMHSLDDAMATYRSHSKLERALEWGSDRMHVANFNAPLTDFAKTVAATVSGNEILRAAERVAAGTATPKMIRDLAASNISPADAKAIHAAFTKDGGGDLIDGVRFANTGAWGDARLAELFATAIRRETNMAVVSPGQEKPLWMSRPVAGLLGQFKAFISGAHERLLLANLQRADAAALSGFITATTLGMISAGTYSVVSGKAFPERPQDWIKEGLSRSGVLGWIDEANMMSAKATGGTADLYRLIGADKPLSRFSSRSGAEMVLGPTVGRLDAVIRSIGAAGAATGKVLAGGDFSDEWKARDTERIRQMIPFQNLWAIRRGLNQVEDGVNRALGVEPLDRQ